MKNFIKVFAILLCIYGCTEKTDSSLIEDSKANAEKTRIEDNAQKALEAQNVEKKTAVNLWTKLPIYTKPTEPRKWITSLAFGRKMTILKDTVIKKKTFHFVEIIEGNKGWVNGYCISIDGQMAIITNSHHTYLAPDPLTITKKPIQLGEIVVLEKQVGDYWKFTTLEKKRSGYLKVSDKISTNENDLVAGKMYNNIQEETDEIIKLNLLKEFSENTDYSTSVFGLKATEILNKHDENNQIIESITDSILDTMMEQAEDASEAIGI